MKSASCTFGVQFLPAARVRAHEQQKGERYNMATILIVEDDLDIAGLLKRACEAEGYSAMVADCCTRAESLLQEVKFDLIVMDRNFPFSPGGVVGPFGPLLAEEYQGKCLVLGISGGLEEGEFGDKILAKPLDRDEFLEAIGELLRREVP